MTDVLCIGSSLLCDEAQRLLLSGVSDALMNLRVLWEPHIQGQATLQY